MNRKFMITVAFLAAANGTFLLSDDKPENNLTGFVNFGLAFGWGVAALVARREENEKTKKNDKSEKDDRFDIM